MNIINVTKENLDREHICCSKSGDCQAESKKAWMAERFQDGLVFIKGDVPGKCFIEYIPAENAWCPIEAGGYMYINCFWVSGQLKGKGYSNLLLDECIKDSLEKGKQGLVILSAEKKIPFLSDPKYLKHKGFQIADTADPHYRLYYLPLKESADIPRFMEHVKRPHMKGQGFVLYYSNQCPYTAKYVPLVERLAESRGVPFSAIRLNTAEEAKRAPAPFTTYSLFYHGEFVTHEILSEKRFEVILNAIEDREAEHG